MRIKTGDTVKVLSGKDRGRTGRIVRVFPDDGRVLVSGLNLKKRHRRSRRQDRRGEVVLLPSPLALSAVQLVCPKCGKPARVGYRSAENGAKVRYCKRCKAAVL